MKKTYDIQKKFHTMAARSLQEGTRFTHFLSLEEQSDALNAAKSLGADVAFYGGFDSAERTMAAFSKDGDDWPIKTLHISWNAKNALGHRDILGALIGLGIKREVLGDIRMGEAEALLYCEETIAEYIFFHFRKVGRTEIVVTEKYMADFIDKCTVQDARIVVSSMRLDSILADAYKIGRAAAQEMIVHGLVFCNHKSISKADYRINENDIISVRGHGRLMIKSISATRKGRLGIDVSRTI